jgi:hypothetical protein
VSTLGYQLELADSSAGGAVWAAGRNLTVMRPAFALLAAINGSTGSCATLSHGLSLPHQASPASSRRPPRFSSLPGAGASAARDAVAKLGRVSSCCEPGTSERSTANQMQRAGPRSRSDRWIARVRTSCRRRFLSCERRFLTSGTGAAMRTAGRRCSPVQRGFSAVQAGVQWEGVAHST